MTRSRARKRAKPAGPPPIEPVAPQEAPRPEAVSPAETFRESAPAFEEAAVPACVEREEAGASETVQADGADASGCPDCEQAVVLGDIFAGEAREGDAAADPPQASPRVRPFDKALRGAASLLARLGRGRAKPAAGQDGAGPGHAPPPARQVLPEAFCLAAPEARLPGAASLAGEGDFAPARSRRGGALLTCVSVAVVCLAVWGHFSGVRESALTDMREGPARAYGLEDAGQKENARRVWLHLDSESVWLADPLSFVFGDSVDAPYLQRAILAHNAGDWQAAQDFGFKALTVPMTDRQALYVQKILLTATANLVRAYWPDDKEGGGALRGGVPEHAAPVCEPRTNLWVVPLVAIAMAVVCWFGRMRWVFGILLLCVPLYLSVAAGRDRLVAGRCEARLAIDPGAVALVEGAVRPVRALAGQPSPGAPGAPVASAETPGPVAPAMPAMAKPASLAPPAAAALEKPRSTLETKAPAAKAPSEEAQAPSPARPTLAATDAPPPAPAIQQPDGSWFKPSASFSPGEAAGKFAVAVQEPAPSAPEGAARNKDASGAPSGKWSRAGEALRDARYRKDMTQAELAAAVGVSVHDVSEMEHGRRPVGRDVAERAAKALGVDLTASAE
jgi:DNA-binding XRE family transcriptional regulator